MTKRLGFVSTLSFSVLALLLGACQDKPGVSPEEPQNTLSQPATKVWDKTFGGEHLDDLKAVVAAPDGGFLLAGNSSSSASGDKTQPTAEYHSDPWVVKVTKDGTKQWDKLAARNETSALQAAVAAPDGGYVVGGVFDETPSDDQARGSRDFWITKLSANGNKVWSKVFGTPGWEDKLASIVATPDGGFLLGGPSFSNASGDKSDDNRGDWSTCDYWVIKINADGTKQWDKTYGGSGYDNLTSILTTSDGGFLLLGSSNSSASGEKSQDSRGGNDYWVIKISSAGAKQWDKTLGGSSLDYLQSAATSPDGGFVLVGYSESRASGEKTQSPKGYYDLWVVKLSKDGTQQWDKSYEDKDPYGVKLPILIAATADNGFLLGGSAYIKYSDGQGSSDYWIAKSDKDGNRQWDKSFTGNDTDYLMAIIPAPDGEFLLGGSSGSNAGGDKSENKRGYLDYWAIKIN